MERKQQRQKGRKKRMEKQYGTGEHVSMGGRVVFKERIRLIRLRTIG